MKKKLFLTAVILVIACLPAAADESTEFPWRNVMPYRAGLDPALPQYPIISQFLATSGDTINAIGDYSSCTTVFCIKPDTDQVFHIRRMIIFIEDVASDMTDTTYGSSAALTTGIEVAYYNNGETVTLTDTRALIKTNSDWSNYCYDIDPNSWGSTLKTNDSIVIRWTFGAAGQHIRLVGNDSDWLAVTLKDDLSGLQRHRFLVQGYRED
jgi:hypothetical protein